MKLTDADISICLTLIGAAQGVGLSAPSALAVAVAFMLGRYSK
jgi:hypothetical protein